MFFPFFLLVCLATSEGAYRRCFGDAGKLNPTGASTGGVAASVKAVISDLPYLKKQKSCYQQVADENCIQASVIAALASRVSGGGKLVQNTDGVGAGGAWGIMQCHPSSGLSCRSCEWDSCCHINMMVTQLLVPYIQQVQTRQRYWKKQQTLQGGVAAYNFGVKNVQTWSRLDVGSSNNDFSSDVMARAQYLLEQGWN